MESRLTLADFEAVGTVYEDDDPELNTQLGHSRETALVPIVFDTEGIWYHPDDSISLTEQLASDSQPLTYFTDLRTFASVTQLTSATIENTITMGDAMDSSIVYIFDPYRDPTTTDLD